MRQAPRRHACSPRVWWWRTADRVDAADLAVLDSGELQRSERYRTLRSATRFVSSRAAARRLLAPLLDTAPEMIRFGRRPCPGCGSAQHGPPRIVRPDWDAWISISYGSGIGLLAVADGPVGVDVERVRPLVVEELAGTALTPAETAALRSLPCDEERHSALARCWTRKEAVLKGMGLGIVLDLSAIETRPLEREQVTVAVGSEPWTVAELPLPTGWSGALALPTGSRTHPSDVPVRAHRRAEEPPSNPSYPDTPNSCPGPTAQGATGSCRRPDS